MRRVRRIAVGPEGCIAAMVGGLWVVNLVGLGEVPNDVADDLHADGDFAADDQHDVPERIAELVVGQIGHEAELQDRDLFFTSSPQRSYHAVVRNSRWKLIMRKPPEPKDSQPRLELYDLDQDPGETTNLVQDQPELRDSLLAALTTYIQDITENPAKLKKPAHQGVDQKRRR